MEKVITNEIKIRVCDRCGEVRDLIKCDFCGKEICAYCLARVEYTQLDNIRGHCLGFKYDKVMCQDHLPGKGEYDDKDGKRQR